MVKNLATTAFAPFRGGVEPASSKGFWVFLYKELHYKNDQVSEKKLGRSVMEKSPP